MDKVGTSPNYDFYIGMDNQREFFNIVPKGSQPPSAGYFNQTWIERVKGEPFPRS
jgi:hypothetical protein